jgi:hypothetical protein
MLQRYHDTVMLSCSSDKNVMVFEQHVINFVLLENFIHLAINFVALFSLKYFLLSTVFFRFLYQLTIFLKLFALLLHKFLA